MIKLNDICFAYDDKPVLSHINLEVNKGEFIVIKGDNGCGKSTLLNIMNGLIFAEQGSYTFNDEVINEKTMKNPVRAKKFHQSIGYVFQNTDAQLFCSNVSDELAFGVRQMGLPDDEVNKRVDDIIDLLKIADLKDKAPYHLSMGEKKKVAIGSVLTVNPQVLILDEPMNFLDKSSREWVKNFLFEMKGIKTIIIVSHSDDFNEMADRIIEL